MKKMIIDTHVHVWDLDRAAYDWLEGDASILHQTYSISQLNAEYIDAGIISGVLVQAAGNPEDTVLMLETAYQTEWISGVVAWLPLMEPGRTQQLLETQFLHEKYFKGVRHQIHDEKDPGWLLQEPVMESLKILASFDIPFDVVAVLPDHIETALEVAERIPGLRMMFDHLGQPPVSSGQRFGKWGELMKKAAQHKNFYAKISGLGTASGDFSGRTNKDIQPYIEFALEQFGTERCCCGGDWPVALLANSYTVTWEVYRSILEQLLTPEEQEQVYVSTAQQFYHLPTN